MIGEQIVSKWVPLTWDAFQDYRRGATYLSARDGEFIGMVGRGELDELRRVAADAGWTRDDGEGGVRKGREALELESKLSKMGLPSPWE